MALSGKVIGAGLGFLLGGGHPLGAVIGGIIGHFVKDAPLEERSRAAGNPSSPEERRQEEEFYFVANLVGICAVMIKADDEVSQKEVKSVRAFFERLGYRGESLEIVKNLLRESMDRPLDLEALCRDFRARSDEAARLLLMECLHDIAHADQRVHPAEEAMLERVGRLLGVAESDWRRTEPHAPGHKALSDLEILGLAPGATPEEIKAAFRELAKKYHPDRVAHLGDEFKELAHKKFVEIRSAYERLGGS